MTKQEREIYEHQIDLERAFMRGFMASSVCFNGEVFVYDRVKVLNDLRYQKALEKFRDGDK